jgi:transposase/transposase-like protein
MHLPKICVIPPSAERAQLAEIAHNGRTPQKLALRAQAVLQLAERQRPQHIARRLGVSRNQVYLWMKRYISGGVTALLTDAARPPGRAPVPPEKIAAIVNATLTTRPPGATHWSSRQLARAQGVSHAMIRKIWRQHRLQPHRVEHFKFSKDPRFVEKLRDVVGLYLNPPDKAVVFCVDAKPNIQALDRTRPLLPLQPGLPARQTHDYRRHGTTTLFAALRVLDGVVIGECHARQRAKEFVQFLRRLDAKTDATLDLHLILDNASAHKSAAAKRWLARHPRFHVHFTPTASSWLNLVERWFGEITRQRIRRGTFESVPALIAAITEYLDHYNQAPKPFKWTKDADTILAKIDRAKACPKPSCAAH